MNSNTKKTCSKCSKNGIGAFSCDGCQQSFCLKHVAEHRQELTSQMNSLEQEHDIYHQDLLSQQQKLTEHELFNRINQWEKESIEKIQQKADESRNVLKQILDGIIHYGEKNLNKVSVKLRHAREYEDFFENDLARWTQQLNHLRAEIQCMLNSIQIINENSTSDIKFIQIVPDQTLEMPDPNWSSPFSWFTDVKALFYDQSQKLPLTEDNERKDIAIQTDTKNSIIITKVNMSDHYIDIENNNWTDEDQNMTGWMLRRDVDQNSEIIYKFPDDFILKHRSYIRILFSKKYAVDEQQVLINDDFEEVWNINSNVHIYLFDANGEEKASFIQICH